MAAERVVHQFPPGELTRVKLVTSPSSGGPRSSGPVYQLVNATMARGQVVLATLTRSQLADLVGDCEEELRRRP